MKKNNLTEQIKDITIKILGFFTLCLLIFGIIYTIFIHKDPEPERLSPAEYKRLEKLYQQGAIEEPVPDEGMQYGGKYQW
ncbi:MAG: hypothetical protein A2660_02040 [Candidatus Doudnabacteria bacterium RIFCSPHIGHO2_01_FULL_45_18]|uniref:Uncharacterized protein n=1 Tax=Candidatus Doudnabacteria bacterium RIFCSPHIGHO2_01_FULL_45_18 TaxID=1817823 RepID=A0A1F5NPZ7_9BACT|nr:MAG: hypothetical protein A2660_02040 [Candidatus Doudnabacteria bacterium RIFCSPHIGHO2_01_FULL_45_18]